MSVEERRLLQMPGTEALEHAWSWFLALGIILMLLGIAAIVLPGLATLATTVFIGWILIIGGLAQVIHSFWSRGWGGFFLTLLAGILSIFVGGLMLTYPVQGVLALTMLLGLFFLLQGVFEIVLSVAVRPLSSWGWVLASGIISLIIGFLILANWPTTAAWAIGLLVGIGLFWAGLARVMIALSARSALARR